MKLKATPNTARWAVIDTIIDPKRGNQVWEWCFTKQGALDTAFKIRSYTYRISTPTRPSYLIPLGGVTIARVKKGKVVR